MDVPAMPNMQMPAPPAESKKHKHAAAPAPASSTHTTHGMDMSSMQGMPMHGGHEMPMQNAKPVELQQLDFGNMIGTRPKPGGLAEGSHGMEMHSMEGMEMSSMQCCKAPPDARSPDYSDGYRYSDMPGMAMSDHSKQGMLLIDQL